MKKILTLALALVLAFSTSSFAEGVDSSTEMKQPREEKMHKMRGEKQVSKKGQMSEKRKQARKQCASRCGINKEKIKACRKNMGAKKGERVDGKCLTSQKKACIKKCMQSKKAAHKKHNKRNKPAETATE